MSIQMDSMEGPDYADYEYQFIDYNVEISDTGGSPNDTSATFNSDFEVLGSIGGLANNEVAELVYLEVQASIEPDFPDDDEDQTVSTAAEFRGILGANLDGNGIGSNGNGFDRADDDIGVTDAVGPRVFGSVSNDDAIFQQFMSRAVLPNDDQNVDVPDSYTAASGGSLDSGIVYKKEWRNMTGRGPVLDQNDDITICGNFLGGDLAGTVVGSLRVHMVFDIAETSDAGRRFSVPSDD